ncbi:MAG: porin [Verrucomicrobiae bacterium]|nr:porin [Verrucomicrobiae bacterium]
MKFNKWTLGLAAVGVVSLASAVQAEERDNPVMTALSSTSISGYVDTAAVWRFGNNTSKAGAGSGWLVPGAVNANPATAAAYQNKADIFNLNAVGLTLEKPLDEAEWSAGYRVDMVYGPDIVGWNPSVNSFGVSDFGLKQAYVVLRAPVGNGLDFKLGTFDTVVGFESFEAYKNPHWTRSYGWEIEPTQHTGALVSYRFNDMIAMSAGIANTAAAGINARPARAGLPAGQIVSETEKTYMGQITLTAPESLGFLAGSTLNAGVVNGLAGGVSDTTWVYVGGVMNTPLEGLKLGAAYDHRMTSHKGDINAAGYVPGTYAYTIAGYLMYQATEKLNLAARVDYAKGTAGTWYFIGGGESNPRNQLLGITGTVDYKLWENVITRLEFRWDHELTGQKSSASTPGPFGFDDNNNYLLALNVIYRF